MYNKEYISYLNTLHTYNAQNPNSYGEKNISSDFFQDVMVEVELSKHILKKFEENEPQVIILTGHAGDGKTSIMYQVLKELKIVFDPEIKIHDYTLPSGRKCRCIKDFSEISDEEKKKVLFEAMNMPKSGDFTFMVANTGPLINTFGEMFEVAEESEQAKIELIDAMDSNTGNYTQIKGYKICVINVATVDNTYFAVEFLKKLTQEKMWTKCEECSKKQYCHINNNRNLIVKNKKQVYEFLNMHYVWLLEYGKRLTIRSMTEQLAYMLTGGFQCNEIGREEQYKYLFSNLFFGYVGTIENSKALNILAIREAKKCGYDQRRLRIDEMLLMNRAYDEIICKDVAQIILDAEQKNIHISGWIEFLRRAYFFTNIVMDEQIIEHTYEDMFSKQYRRYLALKYGEKSPSKMDSNLVCDALSMIYIGTIDNDGRIPLTLSRESGIAQNVQLITGTLYKKNIKLVKKYEKDSLQNNKKQNYSLKLEVNKQLLKSEITLPLLNYFEELKNGIISTNVDPQLSYGIESLKAELSKVMGDEDKELFEMIILKNSGQKLVEFEVTDNKRIHVL